MKLTHLIITGIMLTFLVGCSYPKCINYYIEIPWGEDKYAGTDYKVAKDMANGSVVYISRYNRCK